MSAKQPAVYLLASRRNGTVYIGVTSDLPRRVHEHKGGVIHGFTSRYKVHRLVYYELHGTMIDAIEREKQLKNLCRRDKLELIESGNPEWCDLWDEITS